MVVWVGLILNFWVVGIMWLGGVLPPTQHLVHEVGYSGLPSLPAVSNYTSSDWAFFRMRQLTFGAVTASMIAYLAAQFVDVYVFHYFKTLTKGKHLWIRNNFSTLTSQMVDTIAVILITHFATHALPIDATKELWPQLGIFIASTYVFKMVAAFLDTIPFYLGVAFLRKYLNIADEIA
jgi:uncharacterized integral membrane protein (TIGR00697 family)